MQRAKRLLNETSLPITEIAMRAGFGSLRRFNSVFAEVYGRPPSEIRRKRRSLGQATWDSMRVDWGAYTSTRGSCSRVR
jgi:AraC-like DNA-binding protein